MLRIRAKMTEIIKKGFWKPLKLIILSSYYSQDGNNAAVTGGLGTEELTDITGTIGNCNSLK